MNDISRQQSTLTSLAMLKVRSDGDKPQDYIDYLKPFVVHVLNKFSPYPVTRERVQDLLLQEFGLQIPRRGCELVLRKFARAGYLSAANYQYRLNRELPPSDVDPRRADASRRIDIVVTRLRDFAFRRHELEISPDYATAAILAYLSRFAISCLETYSAGTVLPKIDRNERDIALVGAFIKDSISSDLGLFDDIILVVKGHMLANALLCPDLDVIQKKFRSVTFFLDTPLVLDVLDMHGSQELESALELLAAVTNLGGTFSVFEHTLDEAKRVLSFCEENFQNSRIRNRVLSDARHRNRTRSDIALVRGSISDFLGELSVTVARTPTYNRSYQIDEDSLANVLESETEYPNAKTKLTDINSIRSIYVLRAGAHPRLLEEAKAVLVTPNSQLAKRAFEFGKQFEESREISPVINEFSLGNIAWLKAPLRAENLPKLELIASCYAALEPSKEFWEQFLREIEKLRQRGRISVAQHEFMRADHRIPQELMSLTLGADSGLTESTVEEIIQHFAAEVAQERDQVIQESNRALLEEKRKRIALEMQVQSSVNRAEDQARFRANVVVVILVAILLGLVLIGSFSQYTADFMNTPGRKIVGKVCVVVAVAVGIVSLCFGTTVLGASSWAHTRIFAFFKRRLLRGRALPDLDQPME